MRMKKKKMMMMMIKKKKIGERKKDNIRSIDRSSGYDSVLVTNPYDTREGFHK